MDPLSASANVLGLFAAARRVTLVLVTAVKGIKDAPRQVQAVLTEVTENNSHPLPDAIFSQWGDGSCKDRSFTSFDKAEATKPQSIYEPDADDTIMAFRGTRFCGSPIQPGRALIRRPLATPAAQTPKNTQLSVKSKNEHRLEEMHIGNDPSSRL
ncbi:hypothetical protein ABVK25_006884 [Lepraria finkii]|uniref:Uncharacterized protein n=1 Tax=Lepraria finkii TaxID=1340010 RepID=A0ABR4BAS5_9LECA